MDSVNHINYNRVRTCGTIIVGASLKIIGKDLNKLAEAGYAVHIEFHPEFVGWHVVIRTPVPTTDPRWHIYGEGDDLDFETAVRMAIAQLEEAKKRFAPQSEPSPKKPVLRLIKGDDP